MSDEKKLKVQSKSPVPSSKQGKDNSLFDFPDAMRKVAEGLKISKKSWGSEFIYGVVLEEVLTLHRDDTDFSWVISAGDLAGQDWFVVN